MLTRTPALARGNNARLRGMRRALSIPSTAMWTCARPDRLDRQRDGLYRCAAISMTRSIRAPVLSAGVRQRVLRLMLATRTVRTRCLILVRKRQVRRLEPKSRCAYGRTRPGRALRSRSARIGGPRAGRRARLAFRLGTFSAAYSLDIFEHLDLARGSRSSARNAARPLETGAYFCFSNTRERSWLNTAH